MLFTKGSNETEILIIGGGAVGALFGYCISQPGIKVSFVCRSNYSIVKQSGFHITSPKHGPGTINFRPHAVYPSANDIPEAVKFDYVIVTTKAIHIDSEAASIAPVLHRNAKPAETAIVLFQNGILVEDAYAIRYPMFPLISTVLYVAVSQPEPGKIVQYRSIQNAVLGLYQSLQSSIDTYCPPPPSHSAKLNNINSILTLGKTNCRILSTPLELQQVRLNKILWNASFSIVGILTGNKDSHFISSYPYTLPLIRDIMTEIHNLSVKLYGPGPDWLVSIDTYIERNQKEEPYKSSMIVDWEMGRECEVESILGNVLKLAEANGVSAEKELKTCTVCYRLMKGLLEM